MKERILQITEPEPLFGIASEPTSVDPRAAVLVLNAGLVSRVGPNRLTVALNRRLARSGFVSVRFDLSGIGDSPMIADHRGYLERTTSNVRAVMSNIRQRYGLRRFVLVGLCSGADYAFHVAQREESVVGVFMIDAFHYPTLPYKIWTYRYRLKQVDRWIRLAKGESDIPQKVRGLLSSLRKPSVGGGEADVDVAEDLEVWSVPEKARFDDAVLKLREGGAKLKFVYTKSGPAHFHYRTRFDRVLRRHRRSGAVQVEVFDESDHIFTLGFNRARLIQSIETWMQDLPSAP